MHRKLILMHLDLDRPRLHIKHHVHLARILCAFHLICLELNEPPVEKGAYGRELGVLERAVWDVGGLNAFFGPGDC